MTGGQGWSDTPRYDRAGNPKDDSLPRVKIRPVNVRAGIDLHESPEGDPQDRALVICDGRKSLEAPGSHPAEPFAVFSRYSLAGEGGWHTVRGLGVIVSKTKDQPDPATHRTLHRYEPAVERVEEWRDYVDDLQREYVTYTGAEFGTVTPEEAHALAGRTITTMDEARAFVELSRIMEDLKFTGIGGPIRDKLRLECGECGLRLDTLDEKLDEQLERLWNNTNENPHVVKEVDPPGYRPGSRMNVPLVVLGVLLGAFR